MTVPILAGAPTRPSVAVISTFPPTQCGLATFASALVDGLLRAGCTQTGVIQVGGSAEPSNHPHLVGHLDPDDARSLRAAAEIAAHYDHLIVQHEFGIWGRHDGLGVLGFLDAAAVPATVTLHTVPAAPTRSQREILGQIGTRAARVAVMTRAARSRLLAVCEIEPDRVVIVPHGATVVDHPPPLVAQPTFLTWGLLGPGKGIETVIDALPLVADEIPGLRYVVAGQTHPKVRSHSGERYRHSLVDRARRLGVDHMVSFDDTYRTVPELTSLAVESRAVILPYESTDQVTSGVLVDALAAGRPVIATAFPHALELLGGGAGIVVAHGDPDAIADALRRLTCDATARDMAARAHRIGARHSWDVVSRSYAALASTPAGNDIQLLGNAATGA